MPVRAGELVRAWLLMRSHGVRPAATIGSIVVERILDGLFLCLILVAGLLSLPLEEWMRQGVMLAATIFGIGAFGVIIAAAAPGFVVHMLMMILRPAGAGVQELLLGHASAFLNGFSALGKGRALAAVLVLTVAGWMSEASVYWFLLMGFSLPAGLGGAALGMSAANLATIIPSSPGYVGTFHLPLQSVLTSGYGIEQAEAAAYAIVAHAVLVLPIAALGVGLLAREGLSLAAVQQSASRLRRELGGHSSGPGRSKTVTGKRTLISSGSAPSEGAHTLR
jgi:uncharacterized membrane protein YbhN (UPF0104 family)